MLIINYLDILFSSSPITLLDGARILSQIIIDINSCILLKIYWFDVIIRKQKYFCIFKTYQFDARSFVYKIRD